jgi:hypothetical protein
VTILSPPAALSNVTRPSIAFAANRRATFTCSLDGAAATPCASPFVPVVPLADGSHEFLVTAADVAGRTGTATARFAVDTTGPGTIFVKHPKAIVRTRKKSVKAAFGLSSSEPNSHFLCKLDNAVFKACAPSSAWSFKRGKHAVTAKAIDSVGNEGAPATYRFKVVKGHGKKHHKGREKENK